MKREFEAGRWVVVLRSGGPPRAVAALALLVCLGGWAGGEWFAISSALRALPPGGFGGAGGLAENPARGPELLFLAVWLGGWTLGGLLVIGQLLRNLVGHDRIEYDGAGLRRLSGLGPLVAGRVIARDQLQGISIVKHGLVARTPRGRIMLTRFGTPAELNELMLHLRQQLQVDGDARDAVGATPDQPPEGWACESAPGRSVTLRRTHGPLNPLRREYRLAPGRVESGSGIAGRLRWRSLDNPDLAIETWTDSDRDQIYRLVVRHVGGRSEVAQTIDDPFELVQLGRWMARRIERPLELPRELRERFAA